MKNFLRLLLCCACALPFLALTAQDLPCITFKQANNLSTTDLDQVPQVRIEILDTAAVKGFLLLSTKQDKDTTAAYVSSLQLVDLKHPSPPAWFTTLDENERAYFDNCNLQPNGNITVFVHTSQSKFQLPRNILENQTAILEGYLQINKNFEPVDFSAVVGANSHDFKVYPNGERIFLKNSGKYMNLSKITLNGHPFISRTYVGFETVQIVDANNKTVFTWEPLNEVDISEMYFDKYAADILYSPNYNFLQFSRINSVYLDPFDGNVLVSLRRSDMCLKIDRQTGKILWRLGGIKSDYALDDTSKFYLQHDFKRIADGPYKGCYSVFNNGYDQRPLSEGIIYRLDEVNKTARVVARFNDTLKSRSLGQGNFDAYPDSTFLVNYGNRSVFSGGKEAPNVTLFKNGKKIANLYLPNDLILYRAVWVKDLGFIKQPQLKATTDASGQMSVAADSNYTFIHWSKDDKSNNEKKTPDVYYTTPKGVGYVVSKPRPAPQGAGSVSYPIEKIGPPQRADVPVDSCALGIWFSNNRYDLKNIKFQVDGQYFIAKP